MLNELKKRVKKGARKARKVSVDVAGRMERSFGTPVNQLVEVHYRGKPMTFSYMGPIETVTIDVIKRVQLENNPEIAESEVKFDPTKRRLDTATAYISCSCGTEFKKELDIAVVESRDIKEIMKKTKDIDMQRHYHSGHEMHVDHTESKIEVIPEDMRIKDWNPERINYYRLFPKKTADIKYLVTYGQDLLAEAEQWKYKRTEKGSNTIYRQNSLFSVFVVGLLMLLEYVIIAAMRASQNVNPYLPSSSPPVSYLPWYILISVVIIMFGIMWRLHIHDISNQEVKYIQIQSAPFFISNRGVLPVVMTNAVIDQVWDYQARVMQLDQSVAKDIYYSLATWSDDAIAQLYRAKMLGHVEHELMGITNEVEHLKQLDYEYRNMNTKTNLTLVQMIEIALGTFLATVGIVVLMTYMGVGI